MAQNEVVLDGELSLDIPIDGTMGLLTLIEAGIAQIVFNDDYTITFVMTDGREFTTGSIRGAVGEKGDKGDKGDKGEQGERGPQGETGAQGIQGERGEQGVQGIQGEKGDKGDTGLKGDKGDTGASGKDGVSPTVSITEITGGNRITITDADGQHSADVMDGDDYVLTQQDKQEIAGLVDIPVDDVQINGTSIVNNGIAEIPRASNAESGIVGIADANGISITDTGNLTINRAVESVIKPGTNNYRPIVPRYQHMSAFYGLATAAGDSTQAASSNTVGTYTQEAKSAIQSMLGISALFENELIADVTIDEDTASFTVNTDVNGQPFNLRKGIVFVDATAPTTGNKDSISFSGYGLDVNNVERRMLFPTMAWAADTRSIMCYEFGPLGDYPCKTKGSKFQNYGRTAAGSDVSALTSYHILGVYNFMISQYNTSQSLIPAGTRVTIYGIRD